MSSQLPEQVLIDQDARQPEKTYYPIVQKMEASLQSVTGLTEATIARLISHIGEENANNS